MHYTGNAQQAREKILSILGHITGICVSVFLSVFPHEQLSYSLEIIRRQKGESYNLKFTVGDSLDLASYVKKTFMRLLQMNV